MAEFEIDHGDPERPTSRSYSPVSSRPAAEPIGDSEQQQAVTSAVALIEAAGQRRHVVNIIAFGLAAIGGTGLSGLPRIDPWTAGATVGLLAALSGIAHAAWRWRHTRLVADELWSTVAPLDDVAMAKIIERDPNRYHVEIERRATAIARVEELDGELTRCFRRFRLALIGAAVGTLSGWVCAWAGPVGMMTMTGSVGALFGALLGWQLTELRLSPVMIQRLAIGGFICCGVIPALLGGTPLLYTLVGAAVVGGGIFSARRHLTALMTTDTEPTAQDPSAAADESAS